MHLVECVERPEHIVTWLCLLLAAADGSELKVVKEGPELSRCLGVWPDGCDKEIVECRVVGSVEGVEVFIAGGSVEGGGTGVSWRGIHPVVSTAAVVGAT